MKRENEPSEGRFNHSPCRRGKRCEPLALAPLLRTSIFFSREFGSTEAKLLTVPLLESATSHAIDGGFDGSLLLTVPLLELAIVHAVDGNTGGSGVGCLSTSGLSGSSSLSERLCMRGWKSE